VIEPQVILNRALVGHPVVEVTLRYAHGSSRATFPSGPIARAPRVATIDIGNGWVVDTSTTAPRSGVFSNTNAEGLLAGGVALSLLLCAFVLVLATTRTRALRLVDQRTKQLHHQALHDPLTGLANRTLVLDHAEQLLARNRRQGTTPAALFVDLDDFKDVNDTFGHQAGDRLLVAVAGRLATTIRAADTIGRLGGDEFVVLVDGSSLDVTPELVARRILDVMRQPFELDGVPVPISLNASIGIAEGDRESAGDLLRDADVALYVAKGEGKNRCATYQPVPANSGTRWAASTVPTPVDRS
jgi:diguanylate cyclase (GGDEF)-like protein